MRLTFTECKDERRQSDKPARKSRAKPYRLFDVEYFARIWDGCQCTDVLLKDVTCSAKSERDAVNRVRYGLDRENGEFMTSQYGLYGGSRTEVEYVWTVSDAISGETLWSTR